MAFFDNTRDEDIPNESPTLVHLKPEHQLLVSQLKDWIINYLPTAHTKTELNRLEHLIRIGEPKTHPPAFDQLTSAA